MVVDEPAEGQGVCGPPPLCNRQRLPILAGLGQVLERFLACLIERQDAYASQGALLALPHVTT